MASPSAESVLAQGSGMSTPDISAAHQPTVPRQPKLKGRKRLIEGLKRVGSSQSVVSFGRARASSYRDVGPASISCISLSSTAHYSGNVGRSSPENGFSTAPTTPGADTPFIEGPNRIRFIASDALANRGPQSVPLPDTARSASRPVTSAGIPEAEEDYFSRPVTRSVFQRPRHDLNFWGEMPTEIKGLILSMLKPKEIIKCSTVSKSWQTMCFDGQLWAKLDASEFYRDIPAKALVKIITAAGPFAKDLNLRGCVQLWDCWSQLHLSEACRNLQSISLEGCEIDANSIHCLLYQNPRLVHVNLAGLDKVTNSTMTILAQQCPNLELLNVSWCGGVTTRGLRKIIQSCKRLTDLRASEIRGFDDTNIDFMVELYKTNNLERLVLMNCADLSDDSLSALLTGVDAPVDYLTNRRIVPPRKLKHLDLTRCKGITDESLRHLAEHVPDLEGLQLSKCDSITDDCLQDIFPTLTRLTHLDLEELDLLTNTTLQCIARSPFASTLRHLNISYCENLGDSGMLPVIKACTALRNVELDNTRISNLVLIEAADMVRNRALPRSHSWDAACIKASQHSSSVRPRIALRMTIYDCANVTWSGIREILMRNAEVKQRPQPHTLKSSPACLQSPSSGSILQSHSQLALNHHPDRSQLTLHQLPFAGVEQFPQAPAAMPPQLISLKVFYGYQPTVTEHTRRCLSGNFAAAQRLERKWAEYMMASEEAGAPGGFIGGVFAGFVGNNGNWGVPGLANRRRRRRAREAAMMHADEEGADAQNPNIGRRRRARSGGGGASQCSVM